ncbi:MAG: coenzyme F420-0:L-glutamate ligase, partial [Robiginitomaculum sp.]|nr:coenzyme F420-0:L-glutamate ligase [Robiginitomaculum sp.]
MGSTDGSFLGKEKYGVRLGVIIADSIGRAWRRGTVGTAIGASGVEVFQDLNVFGVKAAKSKQGLPRIKGHGIQPDFFIWGIMAFELTGRGGVFPVLII